MLLYFLVAKAYAIEASSLLIAHWLTSFLALLSSIAFDAEYADYLRKIHRSKQIIFVALWYYTCFDGLKLYAQPIIELISRYLLHLSYAGQRRRHILLLIMDFRAPPVNNTRLVFFWWFHRLIASWLIGTYSFRPIFSFRFILIYRGCNILRYFYFLTRILFFIF